MSAYSLQDKVYQSDTFQLNNVSGYQLHLQVTERNVFINVLDSTERNCLYSAHYSDSSYKANPIEICQKLRHLISTHNFLGVNQWKVILVILEDTPFMLVPTALFDENEAVNLLRSVSTWHEAHHDLIFTRHHNGQVTHLSAYHTAFRHLLNDVYPDAHCSVTHQSACFLEGLVRSNAFTANQLHAFLSGEYLYLGILDGHEPLFFNGFHVTAKDDILYFVLSVAEQLKIEPQALELIFYNSLAADNQVENTLRRYVNKLNFATVSLQFGSNTTKLIKFDLWGAAQFQYPD